MKRRAAVALLCAAAAAIAAAFVSHSDAASKASGVIPLFRVGITFNTSTLDPIHSEQVSPFPALERLLELTPDGKLTGVLATRVTQPGPLVYVFHLRHGVKFWDGNEMTSADVVNSLKYETQPTAQNLGLFGGIKSISAKDKYTVVIVLKTRDAGWKYVLSYVGYIFEKKFYDQHKTTFGQPGTLIMGTGAWKLDSFNPTSGAELSANPHWWGGPVPIKHISFKFFSDEVSMALAFKGGAIDFATPVDAQGFEATAGSKLQHKPARWNPGMISLPVNNPPWNDIHVRRAVAYAVNRQDIIAASGAPGSLLSTFIMPDQLRTIGSKAQVDKLIASLPKYPNSLAKAKAEMAQSKYPNGFDTHTDTFQYGGYVKINEVIAQQLKPLGINMKVNVLPANGWVAELAGDKSKLSLEFFTDGPLANPDPNAYPSQILYAKNIPHSFNTAAYAPPDFDRLLSLGVTTQAPARRLSIYSRVLRRLGTDLPYIPLYQTDSNLAISSKYSWPSWAGWNMSGVLPSDWPLGIKAK
jgi:peptide/nickel transport system substrate-binding protein